MKTANCEILEVVASENFERVSDSIAREYYNKGFPITLTYDGKPPEYSIYYELSDTCENKTDFVNWLNTFYYHGHYITLWIAKADFWLNVDILTPANYTAVTGGFKK